MHVNAHFVTCNLDGGKAGISLSVAPGGKFRESHGRQILFFPSFCIEVIGLFFLLVF